jgi:hypothetical protein
MPFNDFMKGKGILGDIPGAIGETITDAMKDKLLSSVDALDGKLQKWRDEYKRIAAKLETVGLKIKEVTFSVVPPAIHTSFSGSIKDINEEKLRKMIEEHKAETLLVALLKILIMTRLAWEHMELKKTGVTLNLTFGMPPQVETMITEIKKAT